MSDVDRIQQPTAPRPAFSSDYIGQELIRLAKLTDPQIAQVRALGKARGISFLEAAIACGVVSREFLMSALSKQYNYPIIQNDCHTAGFSRELVVGLEPFGPAAEAIRTIRTSLVNSAVAQGYRAFAIVGTREGQGASFLAANLAIAFAQMAVRTILVDANLREPQIAGMFGLDPNREGLSDYLLNNNVDDSPIVQDVLPGLSILPSGGVPPNPQELICSANFVALTSSLNNDFGVVIYNSPGAMDYGDAFVIASRVGAAVIAARQDHASFEDLKKVSDKLRSHQCAIVGSVANIF